MPTAYLKKLAKEGKGTIEHLESEWEKAKKLADKQGQGGNFAYITKIFQTKIGASALKLNAAQRLRASLGIKAADENGLTPRYASPDEMEAANSGGDFATCAAGIDGESSGQDIDEGYGRSTPDMEEAGMYTAEELEDDELEASNYGDNNLTRTLNAAEDGEEEEEEEEEKAEEDEEEDHELEQHESEDDEDHEAEEPTSEDEAERDEETVDDDQGDLTPDEFEELGEETDDHYFENRQINEASLVVKASNPYMDELVNSGKFTRQEVDQAWDKAKKIANKNAKENPAIVQSYAYTTGIFKKLLGASISTKTSSKPFQLKAYTRLKAYHAKDNQA